MTSDGGYFDNACPDTVENVNFSLVCASVELVYFCIPEDARITLDMPMGMVWMVDREVESRTISDSRTLLVGRTGLTCEDVLAVGRIHDVCVSGWLLSIMSAFAIGLLKFLVSHNLTVSSPPRVAR